VAEIGEDWTTPLDRHHLQRRSAARLRGAGRGHPARRRDVDRDGRQSGFLERLGTENLAKDILAALDIARQANGRPRPEAAGTEGLGA